MLLLDGVDLAGQRPPITGCFPAQYLSGHAEMIGWIPLHPAVLPAAGTTSAYRSLPGSPSFHNNATPIRCARPCAAITTAAATAASRARER
jgi:hypothetical protein